MKQYTTPDQTAKLIELGLAPTGRIKEVRTVHSKVVVYHDCNFTIGELIEMLPTTIMDKIWWGKEKGEDGIWGLRIDTEGTDYSWLISYRRDNSAYLYQEGCSELVDALYDMIIRLKEEEAI